MRHRSVPIKDVCIPLNGSSSLLTFFRYTLIERSLKIEEISKCLLQNLKSPRLLS